MLAFGVAAFACEQARTRARGQQAAVVEVDRPRKGAQRWRLEAGVDEPIGNPQIEQIAQAPFPEKARKHLMKREMRCRRPVEQMVRNRMPAAPAGIESSMDAAGGQGRYDAGGIADQCDV